MHIRYPFCALALGGTKFFPNISIVDRNIGQTIEYLHSYHNPYKTLLL